MQGFLRPRLQEVSLAHHPRVLVLLAVLVTTIVTPTPTSSHFRSKPASTCTRRLRGWWRRRRRRRDRLWGVEGRAATPIARTFAPVLADTPDMVRAQVRRWWPGCGERGCASGVGGREGGFFGEVCKIRGKRDGVGFVPFFRRRRVRGREGGQRRGRRGDVVGCGHGSFPFAHVRREWGPLFVSGVGFAGHFEQAGEGAFEGELLVFPCAGWPRQG